MARKVLFFGTLIQRPGAYTRIDASQFEEITLTGIGIVGLIGEADGGQPRVVKTWRTSGSVRDHYRAGNLVEAADIVARPGNDRRIPGGAQIIATYKVNNSTKSSLTKTPFVFNSVDYGVHTNDIQMTLSNPDGGNERVATFTTLDRDGLLTTVSTPKLGTLGKLLIQYTGVAGGAQIHTDATAFTATTFAAAGYVLSGYAPFNLDNLQTVIFSIDGGPDQPFTFSAAAASVTSGNGPWTLAAGNNLVITTQAQASQTFTFNAVAAYVQGVAGTFSSLDTTTLKFKVDGGMEQTVTFDNTCVDAASTRDFINGNSTGVTASVVGGQVRVTSNKAGTSSSVEITGTNAAAGFANTTLQSGSGNVANIAAVTAAEAVAILAGLAGATPTVVGSALKLTSTQKGTGSLVQVLASSTADTAMSLDNMAHNGTGDAANIAQTTAAEVVTKLSGLTGSVASVVTDVIGNRVKVTSSLVAAGSSVQVKNTSTATGLGFDNTVHVGGGVVSGDNLNLPFTTYKTLAQLIRAINATGVYTASSLITSDTTWDTTYFDLQTIADAKPLPVSVYARNWDLFDYLNNNVSLVTATLTKGAAGPIATFTATPFAGGTLGTSANSDWATAYTRMGAVRINQLVPLCSENGTNGNTYTFASVSAGALLHAIFANSIAGRSEREIWMGMKGTKTQLQTQAQLFNSEHMVLLGQRVARPSAVTADITVMPEWSSACVAAGMRAGAPSGEPLTWKYGAIFGLEQDVSWSDADGNVDPDSIQDLTDSGVMLWQFIVNKGYRIERGITTYTRTPNDALAAEETVQVWKQISYELRTVLEDRYVGRPNSAQRIATVPTTMVAYFEEAREAGLIVDSLIGGRTQKGYRGITAQSTGNVIQTTSTFSPAQGIDFVLNTLVLVPATASLAA